MAIYKDELLVIDTEEFTLVFLGPLPSENSFTLQEFKGGQEIEVDKKKCLKNICVENEHNSWPLLKVENISNHLNSDKVSITIGKQKGQVLHLPIFFENIDYSFLLTNKKSTKYSLSHDYSSINNTFTYFDKQNSLAGTFNFGNNVGTTRFEIKANNKTHFVITATVFSIKIDFLKDRLLMLKELGELHQALVYKLVQPTKSLGSSETRKSLGVEWLTSFIELNQELLKLLVRIEEKAHHQIQQEDLLISPHKIKKPNKNLNSKIIKYGKDNVLGRKNVLVKLNKVKVNTKENKYIKFLAQHLSQSSKKWLKYIKSADSVTLKRIRDNEDLLQRLELSVKKLSTRTKNKFWDDVGESISELSNRTTFQFQILFQNFERVYKKINRGITLHLSGNQSIHTLSMAELYEIWTYTKLVEILSVIINGPASPLTPKLKLDSFQVFLGKGKGSNVNISKDISVGTQWNFTTNSSLKYFSPLVQQEPDLVIENKSTKELNILDAKYKIAVKVLKDGRYFVLNNKELISLNIKGCDVLYIPKDEDINTMHRYKDSIYSYRGIDIIKPVKHGIILFPHRPTIAALKKVHISLDNLIKYKIGALPLSPGKEDVSWFKEFKDKELLITHDNENEQVRIFANGLFSILATR